MRTFPGACPNFNHLGSKSSVLTLGVTGNLHSNSCHLKILRMCAQVAGIDLSDRLRGEEQKGLRSTVSELPGARTCLFLSQAALTPNAPRPVAGIRAGHAYASICPPPPPLLRTPHPDQLLWVEILTKARGQTHKNVQKAFLCYFSRRKVLGAYYL